VADLAELARGRMSPDPAERTGLHRGSRPQSGLGIPQRYEMSGISKYSNRHSLLDRIYMWSIPEPNSGCWLWLGTLDKYGYGIFSVGGKKAFAHRISLTIHGFDLASSECALHRCDNRICVNPEHLYAGSNADNMRDKVQRGRSLAGSKNANAKLTEQQVLEIRSLDISSSIAAARYGVGISTIQNIRSGYRWGHI